MEYYYTKRRFCQNKKTKGGLRSILRGGFRKTLKNFLKTLDKRIKGFYNYKQLNSYSNV